MILNSLFLILKLMFSKTKIITYLFLLAFTVITVAPIGFLYAADPPSYVPLAPLPPPPPDVVTQTGLAGYLQTLFWLAITLAGVLAVLMIVKGGVLYMTSEAFNTKQAAKTQITMAIVGFLLAISSVLILTTINPDLLKFKLLVRPLVFEVPPLAAGSIPGCTNVATPPVAFCTWADITPHPSCERYYEVLVKNNDWVTGTDSYCAGDKTAPRTTCCNYISPKQGCSGRGQKAGYIQCQWSVEANFGPDDCTVAKGVPAGLTDVGFANEYICAGNDSRTGVDCCAKK